MDTGDGRTETRDSATAVAAPVPASRELDIAALATRARLTLLRYPTLAYDRRVGELITDLAKIA